MNSSASAVGHKHRPSDVHTHSVDAFGLPLNLAETLHWI